VTNTSPNPPPLPSLCGFIDEIAGGPAELEKIIVKDTTILKCQFVFLFFEKIISQEAVR